MLQEDSGGDASDRARYFFPERSYGRPLKPIKEHVFLDERDRAMAPDASTGLILLDRSEAMETGFPATTPNLLAAYLVVTAGDHYETLFQSSGEVYCVVNGSGRTEVAGQSLKWDVGDVLVLPGGCAAKHSSDEGAILFVCSDQPCYTFLGATPSNDPDPRTRTALFLGEQIARELTSIHAEHDTSAAVGKAVVLYTQPFERALLATPGIQVSMNSLEPGGDQRPHKHAAAALTLALAGEAVFSVVDDQKIDWSNGAVMLTPPNAVHSHHNRGADLMRSFVVQDAGLHAHMRTSGFTFVD